MKGAGELDKINEQLSSIVDLLPKTLGEGAMLDTLSPNVLTFVDLLMVLRVQDMIEQHDLALDLIIKHIFCLAS